jgi:transketolase
MNKQVQKEEAIALAARIRCQALQMAHRANASHIGSCLSAADLLAHLYGWWLRIDPKNPDWPDRDRFILSKGHAAAAAYAALALRGFFPIERLETYCQDGEALSGHITHTQAPGVEVSTGSLGHGLPIGVGMALAAKRFGKSFRVAVLMSDGECDEGSTWEAALLAPHLGLDNLLALIDYNKIQSLGRVEEVAPLEPFAGKWRAFRWACEEIDGHDHDAIANALSRTPLEPGKPTVFICHTVKGKGVDFMEDTLAWHYKSPDAEQLKRAIEQIKAGD